MAHITEVRIDGLLGRSEPVHIRFDRGVNIFFGENGSGKTTLLKILDAALSRDGEAMHRLPVERAEVSIYTITEAKIIKHVWERKEPRRSTAVERHLALLKRETIETFDGGYRLVETIGPDLEWKLTPAAKESSSRARRWEHTFLQTTRLYFGDVRLGRPGERRPHLPEHELDQAFGESVNRAWLQFYSQTLNAVRNIQESGLRTVLRQVLSPEGDRPLEDSADAGAVYLRVAKFLTRQPDSEKIALGSPASFKRRYEQDHNLRRIVDNLDNVERQIEGAMIPVDSFLSTITALFSRGKSLSLSSNELQVLLADGQNLPKPVEFATHGGYSPGLYIGRRSR